MGRFFRNLLRILDGSPLPGANRQLGQSLVEMAFITPLLAFLIAGIAEVGWFANHQLILMEVTRAGARAGTVLQGEFSAGGWNEMGSIPQPIADRYVADIGGYPSSLPGTYDSTVAASYRICPIPAANPGFYNFISCLMINSLDPLTIRYGDKVINDRSGAEIARLPYPDDLVISVFALQAINNAPLSSVDEDLEPDKYKITKDFGTRFDPGMQVIVVGRYPRAANECTLDVDENGNPVANNKPDPFDYYDENNTQTFLNLGAPLGITPVELAAPDTGHEIQRGYAFTGQHRVHEYCYGSEWDNETVTERMNLPSMDLTGDKANFLPSQGLVLVEAFWMHQMLLDFPLMQPLANSFGSDGYGTVGISAWAAFPVPDMEPGIIFNWPR